MQGRVLADVVEPDQLHSMSCRHYRCDLRHIASIASGCDRDGRVSRQIHGVVAREHVALILVRASAGADRRAAAKTDQARLTVISGESQRRIVRVEADAPDV